MAPKTGAWKWRETYPLKNVRGCSSRHLPGTRNNRRPLSRKAVPCPKGPKLRTAKPTSARTQTRPGVKTKKGGSQRPDKYETLTPTRDGSRPLVLFPKNPQLPPPEIQGLQKHWFSTSLAQKHPSSPGTDTDTPRGYLRHPTTTLTVQTSKSWRTCLALHKKPHRH